MLMAHVIVWSNDTNQDGITAMSLWLVIWIQRMCCSKNIYFLYVCLNFDDIMPCDLVLLADTNQHMRDACLKSWFGLHVNYCECETFIKYIKFKSIISLAFSICMLKSIISYPWFSLVGGYKSAYKRLLSRVMTWSPRCYELLWA
jgi:hypothetical protein